MLRATINNRTVSPPNGTRSRLNAVPGQVAHSTHMDGLPDYTGVCHTTRSSFSVDSLHAECTPMLAH